MCSVYTKPKELKNAQIAGQFGFVFQKTRAGKSRGYSDVIVFKRSLPGWSSLGERQLGSPLRARDCAQFQSNRQATQATFTRKPEIEIGVFKFLRFEESFWKKADELEWTVGLAIKIKLRS